MLCSQISTAQVHQKAQQAGVLDLGVIPGLQGFQILLLLGILGPSDEVVETFVYNSKISTELSLAGHELGSEWKVPVGDVKCGTVFCFFEDTIDCFDDWAFPCNAGCV